MPGLVVELGDVLVVELQVQVLPFGDDRRLGVRAAGPGLPGRVLVRGGPFQPAPQLDSSSASARRAQRGGVVHAEDEVDPLGPGVEVGGQGEVGVPAQAHPGGVRGDQIDGLVDPVGRALVAGGVARAG